jgi:hypothetical protein
MSAYLPQIPQGLPKNEPDVYKRLSRVTGKSQRKASLNICNGGCFNVYNSLLDGLFYLWNVYRVSLIYIHEALFFASVFRLLLVIIVKCVFLFIFLIVVVIIGIEPGTLWALGLYANHWTFGRTQECLNTRVMCYPLD